MDIGMIMACIVFAILWCIVAYGLFSLALDIRKWNKQDKKWNKYNQEWHKWNNNGRIGEMPR